MISVFIDANIWLSLYDFSSDDLEQFRKLGDMIDTDVEILFTEQVRDEVYRNRENKIKDVLVKFEKFTLQIPNICKGYEEYDDFKNRIRDLSEKHALLLRKIKQDAKEGTLHADKVINSIFERIKPLGCTAENIEHAKQRYDKGNPPGKDGKYGDAINWEILLELAPKGEDLFFVSADKDYRSTLDDNSFNQFLYNEWKMKKESNLFFYRSLTDFINNHVSTIELKSENEKNASIEALRRSVSFAGTHRAISLLARYATWSPDQVVELCNIAEDNPQVRWIIDDDDVRAFFTSLLSNGTTDKVSSSAIDWVFAKLKDNENSGSED